MQIKWCSYDFTLGREKLNKKTNKTYNFSPKKKKKLIKILIIK